MSLRNLWVWKEAFISFHAKQWGAASAELSETGVDSSHFGTAPVDEILLPVLDSCLAPVYFSDLH